MNSNYLLGKILDADFKYVPFKHIKIENFFMANHFDELIKYMEIFGLERQIQSLVMPILPMKILHRISHCLRFLGKHM